MRELDQAPNGIIGLETLLPICIKALIEPGHLTWPQLIEKLTVNPARVLGIDRGTLQAGRGRRRDRHRSDRRMDHRSARSSDRRAAIVRIAGWKVRGRADTVLVGGLIKFQRRTEQNRNGAGKE